jgi:hypothetical protein
MSTSLHVIASCADRKRSGFGEEILLRRFNAASQDARARNWWQALTGGEQPLAAVDLYVGPYWATVRSLRETAAADRFALDLWVASAGYGLLHSSTKVRPYSATFARNQPDSVVRHDDRSRGIEARGWWKTLGALSVPGSRRPRRIATLAKSDPRARFLVIGSPGYVAAIEDDLVEALKHLKRPNQLVIVSGAPGPQAEELRDVWVESNARLLQRVKGSLPALHARVAKRILDETPQHGFDAAELRARWAEIAKRSRITMKPQRTVTTDEDVKKFIRDALRDNPAGKQTRLLHDFRAAGRACEQKRFKGLFEDVVKERAR